MLICDIDKLEVVIRIRQDEIMFICDLDKLEVGSKHMYTRACH